MKLFKEHFQLKMGRREGFRRGCTDTTLCTPAHTHSHPKTRNTMLQTELSPSSFLSAPTSLPLALGVPAFSGFPAHGNTPQPVNQMGVHFPHLSGFPSLKYNVCCCSLLTCLILSCSELVLPNYSLVFDSADHHHLLEQKRGWLN